MKKQIKVHAFGVIRSGILFFCIFGLWWFFRTYELFIMLVLFILAAIGSIAVLWAGHGRFSVFVKLPALGIGKEHIVPFSITVENRYRFLSFPTELQFRVRNVFTEFEEAGVEKSWAPPGKHLLVEKDMLSHHMGRIEITVTEFRVRDWLGICSLGINAKRDGWTIVGPEAAGTTGAELTASVEDFPNENETKKRGTDINPDYEIREYIPGDDLKNIHWKLTAKQGKTMVRERLATGREKINVLLALTADAEENDALMTSLYELGEMLLDQGYPVRLCWLGHGGVLQGRYLAEEGELEHCIDEILSVSGKRDPSAARAMMETEYPGEAYILVQNGAYKGAYIR